MFFVGTSVVCAEDVSDIGEISSDEVADEVISVDDDVNDVSTSDVDEETSIVQSTQDDYTWADFQSEVEDTSVNTVKLNKSNIAPSSSSSDQVTINHDITIVGGYGYYIGNADWNSAASYDYIPMITSGNNLNVKFENVTFQYLSNNILMKLMGNGNYAFKNCVFTNINCTGSHQSVIWLNYGYALLENCTFTNIKSSFGAITNYYSSWGTGVNNARMTVRDCEFYDNIGLSEPGCINNCGYLEVYDSTFEDNSAAWWAGAIHTHNYANTSIWNSVFKNNRAGWNGGALYAYSDLQVYNSIFVENACTGQYGGGAIGSSNRVRVTVDNSTFINNTASASRGGAIWANGPGYLTVDKSLFVNNTARENTEGQVMYYSYTGSSDTAAYFTYTNNRIYGPNNGVNSIYAGNSHLQVFAENNTIDDYSNYTEPADDPITGTITIPGDVSIGTQVWNSILSGAVKGTPLVDGNVVYVPNGNSIYCLDINDGSLIWNVSSNFYYSSEFNNFHDLVLHNGVLIAPCDWDKVYFFNATNGNEIQPASNIVEGSSYYAPLVVGNTIYISNDYGNGDNSDTWVSVIEYNGGVYSYVGSLFEITGVSESALLSQPILWNNHIYVNTVNGLVSYNLNDGTTSSISGTVGNPIIDASGNICILSNNGNSLSLLDSNLNVMSSAALDGACDMLVSDGNGNVYTVDENGYIYYASYTSSSLSCSKTTFYINPITTAMTCYDGQLYIGDNNGILWVFNVDYLSADDIDEYSLYWAFDTGSAITGGIVVTIDGTTYFGTSDGHFYRANNQVL
ncbi:PQQ-binding-like beta-propeller repeat protein [uncultured Methanobrevibacter sp.]|uniref:outer membrane protein assembly factor BamB family protein n=1 Tax=uncultured Methanobrevibacter sp. TaxID=253161 RepID=UPI0025FE265D|nr:PQQ-binding-like beta-propeller repeat protein [uncultured Methanobrevibacter sp.]